MPTEEQPDLTKKVHEVPHKPGVYLMRDRFNRVIYVGKARDLRKRVGSYFMPSKIAVADSRRPARSPLTESSQSLPRIREPNLLPVRLNRSKSAHRIRQISRQIR